jgi:periplasmic protein TonB
MSDVAQFLESRRARIGRWAVAALIVCVLHVGGAALALMSWPEEEADDPAAGAMSVDMAPPAAARVDSVDLPPGPEEVDRKLAPEASKEVVEKVQEDIPPVERSPAPEPEVTLPKPQPEKEQPKEEPKEATPDKQQVEQQDADTVATAPPPVEAQPAPSAAQSPNPSPSNARAQAIWERSLLRQIERHRLDYSFQKWRGMKGEVLVRFKMDETGQLIASEVTRSSGSPALDDAALRLLHRASPFPRPPAGVLLDFTMPIRLQPPK